MYKKLTILGCLFFILMTVVNFAQDEMIYYENFYPAYLQQANQRIKSEIIAYLEDKVKNFQIEEEISSKLDIYVKSCGSYDEIDPMEFIKESEMTFSRIWGMKGKVFSRQDVSNKLKEYDSLFQSLNARENVNLALSITGELELGFDFAMIIWLPK